MLGHAHSFTSVMHHMPFQVAFIAAAEEAGLEAVVRISTANMLISLDAACVYAQCHAKIEKYIAEKKAKVCRDH